MKHNEPSRLMTVEEAARAIHDTVRPGYIRAAIRDGRLTAVQHGKRYYVEEADLRRFAKCPDRASRPASGSERMASGSSSMGESISGQVLAVTAADQLLKRRSRHT